MSYSSRSQLKPRLSRLPNRRGSLRSNIKLIIKRLRTPSTAQAPSCNPAPSLHCSPRTPPSLYCANTGTLLIFAKILSVHPGTLFFAFSSRTYNSAQTEYSPPRIYPAPGVETAPRITDPSLSAPKLAHPRSLTSYIWSRKISLHRSFSTPIL